MSGCPASISLISSRPRTNSPPKLPHHGVPRVQWDGMSNENLSAPVAAVHPVTRSFHGREFVDNYEWLRDKESQETLD